MISSSFGDVADSFGLNPLNTAMAFRSAKTGATIVEYNAFLEIISIDPVSTAECERGFSTLNNVCTKERNRMLGPHLHEHLQCCFVYHLSVRIILRFAGFTLEKMCTNG